jgi:ABC-type nitrate/sulfonate/bicarbonate transport system substrate-binding protein
MRHWTSKVILAFVSLLVLAAAAMEYRERNSLSLIVSVPALSVSRLPYVIAQDQGLFEKYGLRVELWMASPESEDTVIVSADWLTKLWRMLGINTPQRPDVEINGSSPMMVRVMESSRARRQTVIASTDCVVRAHVIGSKGMSSLSDLKGKRIGVSALPATAGFQALLLAKRMGWDPVHDIAIIENAEDVKQLLDGTVDAVVGYEREYADAKRAGLPILQDMKEWNESLGGNSAMVDSKWLKDATHREAARRFVKATTEAIALFHRHPEIAFHVMDTWYGIKDRDVAQTIYDRGAWIPKKPYPCYEGLKKTMELYDSNEMRRHSPEEFYDDSFVRELDSSGFIDTLYQ